MFYLIMAIVSSAMIAIIMRISTRKIKGNLGMIAMNYLVCLLLGAWYADFQLFPIRAPEFPLTVGMGIINGMLYLSGFVLLQYNTRVNGVVLSSVFVKLGLLMPIALSVFLFAEIPTVIQCIGFVLAVGAIILINYEKGALLSGIKPSLILLLLAGGFGDAMAKIFEVYGSAAYADLFLFYTFVSAILLCIVLILRKKEKFDPHALLFGAVIGIPNFFSAKFLLMALNRLPAVIVYPTFSVGGILVITLAGIFFFKEHLRKTQWIALAIIFVTLVLLNL